MNDYLAGLTTEAVNPDTLLIDECTTEEMVQLMNQQDALVFAAIAKETPQIAKAVDVLHHRLSAGGRMFYIGAGTSGRLGVLDASECPPTFGTDPSLVQGYIAGGDTALRNAVEGCEDDEEGGVALIESIGVTDRDVVVGISASGSAKFVIGALTKARQLGAATLGVCNNKGSKLEPIVDICISPVVGPEVISGSTRLKAGTAQKLVLNMLTTCTMVKLGKTYNNLMVDLKASNIKLVDRSIRIIVKTTGVDPAAAAETLEKAGMNCKLAIMMIKTGLEAKAAEQALNANGGRLKQAIVSLI
ncbi:N-acetylmuramic acid 6-phosphate etherase [Paenibacillus sp. F411]|uniref:N-acetylmuramic acid 6-phosphate etherase n=1 Tax=Paenibacillus algicola TaxID=2565926 RepID=A0A4P8XF29_9BACL|nr:MULTISPECIES: N-acetylmuramic acid 6-phosphate etherase [Paenibacillus]MBO2945478.1 N-acetylmuramic acid 6-phosphate etherase [Paenibacillus sp. F411]QCT00945.1 N-acetylmuramic acid 6-phosphate etherase [Paenibacillus algicola]